MQTADPGTLSVLWHALEKAGDKRKDEKVRERLPAGGKIPVGVTVTGKVDSRPVELSIDGHLQVAHDGTTGRKTLPDVPMLLAIVLAYVPKTRRAAILEELPQAFAETKTLPAADPELLELATELVADLTITETRPRAGAVSFEFVGA